jgi:hypothetical protein
MVCTFIYPHFFYVTTEIVGLAVDTPSADYGQAVYPYTHVLFCSHNVYALENVKDTCLLPAAGATVNVFPNKVRGASGAPVRIIASWTSRFTDLGWMDDTSDTSYITVSHSIVVMGLIAYMINYAII